MGVENAKDGRSNQHDRLLRKRQAFDTGSNSSMSLVTSQTLQRQLLDPSSRLFSILDKMFIKEIRWNGYEKGNRIEYAL